MIKQIPIPSILLKFLAGVVIITVLVISYGLLARNFPGLGLPLLSFLPSDMPSVRQNIQSSQSGKNGVVDSSVKQTTPHSDMPEDFELDFAEVNQIVKLLEDQQRGKILSDFEAFERFIQSESVNKSILAAAHANRIDQNTDYLFLAKRAYDQILRDIYLGQLIKSRIPDGFPSEEQMRAYYDENRDRFVVGKRVQVWQVFLPLADVAETGERERVKKQAESIVMDLRADRIDFAEAAKEYSLPQAGKYSAGYLGLIKINEIKPEIKEPLLALDPDSISEPVITNEGIHILKRGNIIPEQVVSYDEAREQIRQLLTSQLQNGLKKSINRQAATAYPMEIPELRLKQWWEQLREADSANETHE